MRKLKPKTMQKIRQAHAIVGNQPRYAIRNMVKALSMLPRLNTVEENERLAAAKILLRHWYIVHYFNQ